MEAAITILGEVRYDRMTMNMVAVSAKAARRQCTWSSMGDMVLDAVAQMKREQVELGNLPNTGTLRGDLLALFKSSSVEESERKLRALAGLSISAEATALPDRKPR